MKTTLMLTILTLLSGAFTLQTGFLNEQKKFERVRTAVKEKEQIITEKLRDNDLTLDNFNILIVAYKDDDELVLYAKKKTDKVYSKLATYEICSRSGQLGPKRRQGDNQVPEGFYHIDRFNPTSNFYLSLRLNYPNQADRKKSKASNLGGDIFIHGSCVTIGCMPMTDDKIKEIYLYAVYAKNNGQDKIPVYVFPFRMTEQNFSDYTTRYKDNKELTGFWSNLRTGYVKFTTDMRELNVRIDSNGDYIY
jgi:murein L,D-transpeptidase YafK